MTARDLLKLVRPDHEFTLTLRDPDLNLELNTAQVVELRCSCRWTVRRAVHMTEIDNGYSNELTQAWTDRMTQAHLLDQQVAIEDILRAIEEGVLA